MYCLIFTNMIVIFYILVQIAFVKVLSHRNYSALQLRQLFTQIFVLLSLKQKTINKYDEPLTRKLFQFSYKIFCCNFKIAKYIYLSLFQIEHFQTTHSRNINK